MLPCVLHTISISLISSFSSFFGGSRDSIVSIAIRYKLGGPAFESQQVQDVSSSPMSRKEISPRNVASVPFDHLNRLLDRKNFIGEIFCSPKPSVEGSAVH